MSDFAYKVAVPLAIELASSHVPLAHAALVSEHLRRRKQALRWSDERLAEEAQARLWPEVRGRVEISAKIVSGILNGPRRPFRTYQSRAIIAAVVAALGADAGLVNRHFGGI